VLHQAHGDFKHVVTQRKVAEAVPRAECTLADAAFGIVQVLLCVFVEAWHFEAARVLGSRLYELEGEGCGVDVDAPTS
jgi:hypothetical protein